MIESAKGVRWALSAAFLAIVSSARRVRTWIKVNLSGTVIQSGSGLHIGARTRLWAVDSISLGRDVYIGKDVTIECNAIVGNFVLIANRVALIGRHDHDFRAVGFPIRYSPWIGRRRSTLLRSDDFVRIEDDVWVGFGSIVLTGVTLGRGCVVAAGSVVSRDVLPYSIVAGVPATVIGNRFDDPSDIARHESAIRNGRFGLSERGYGYCVIEPGPTGTSGSNDT